MNLTFLSTMLTGLNILQQTLLYINPSSGGQGVTKGANTSVIYDENLLHINCIVGQFGYDAHETVCERGAKYCKVMRRKNIQRKIILA
jgi:hypothetical protein